LSKKERLVGFLVTASDFKLGGTWHSEPLMGAIEHREEKGLATGGRPPEGSPKSTRRVFAEKIHRYVGDPDNKKGEKNSAKGGLHHALRKRARENTSTYQSSLQRRFWLGGQSQALYCESFLSSEKNEGEKDLPAKFQRAMGLKNLTLKKESNLK